LLKKFSNWPLNKNLLKGNTFYKGNAQRKFIFWIHFCILIVSNYFTLWGLFKNMWTSAVKLTVLNSPSRWTNLLHFMPFCLDTLNAMALPLLVAFLLLCFGKVAASR
jgi:hypothetical protein